MDMIDEARMADDGCTQEPRDLPSDVLAPWAAKAMMKDADHIVSMIRDMEESSAGEDWYDAKRLAIRNTLLEWYDIGYGTAFEHAHDGTDWEYLRSMTPEQIHQAALDDPDNPPLTPEQLAKMRPAAEWEPLRTHLREARERGRLELSEYLPVERPLTREELEAAIDQYGFAMAIVGKWGGRHKDERAWQEMLAAKADAERTIAVLLDWIPWGGT